MNTRPRILQRVFARWQTFEGILLQATTGWLPKSQVSTTARLAVFVAFAGIAFDATKSVLFHEWAPNPVFGPWLLVIYAVLNMGLASAAWIVLAKHQNQYIAYFLFGVVIALPGIVETLVVQRSVITVVWHGAIGFFAGVSVAVNHFAHDVQNQSHYASHADARLVLEIRKELLKELQWSMTTLVQVLAAFSATFGVAMTLLYRVAPAEEHAGLRLTDLAATGVQMSVGFGACLFLAYLWGLAPGLAGMASIRRTWTLPPPQSQQPIPPLIDWTSQPSHRQ